MGLIERQDAIDALNKMKIYRPLDSDRYVISDCLNKIVDLPSAQPEIVRCKDCKHRYMEDMIWHCPFALMGGENFFCGYGSLGTVERRRDG